MIHHLCLMLIIHPDLISYIGLIYYHISEYYACYGSLIECDDDGTVISKKESGYNTVLQEMRMQFLNGVSNLFVLHILGLIHLIRNLDLKMMIIAIEH